MNTGEGLHRTVDPADGRTYLYTHFEVPEARRVYATFEQPDLKAQLRVHRHRAGRTGSVLSNSPTPTPTPALAADGAIRAARRPGGSHRRRASRPTSPRSSPATTTSCTDTYTSPDGRVVPFGVACRRSLAEYLDAGEIFEITKQGFDYYIEHFDQPYPFAKYDQVFVPEYNIGAMENVGCVTFTEAYLFRSKATEASRQSRAETILHELAHMWFGDLVTMRWWDDLWLKESFATYLAARCLAEATRYRDAWTTFASDDKTWALRQDELPSTHPIVADIRDLDDVALELRRHHVRQGRGGAQAARRVGRRGRVLRRRAALLRRPRLGQHDAGRPAGRAGARRPVATCRPGRASGCRPPARTRCARRSPSATTAGSRPSRSYRRRRPSTRHCDRTGSRSASTTAHRAGRVWSGSTGSSSTSSAPAPRCPRWSAGADPTWSCSTTTT